MDVVRKPLALDVKTGPAANRFRVQLQAHARGKKLRFTSQEVDFLTLFLIEVTDDLLPTILSKAKVHEAHWRVADEHVVSNNRTLLT